MDANPIPARPNLEQYKKQAKDLLKAYRSADVETIRRVRKNHPRFEKLSEPGFLITKFALADAQLVIAREHRFESWPKFAKHIQDAARRGAAISLDNPVTAFIKEAVWLGPIDRAEQILAAYPEIAQSSIHVAAIRGDDATVRRFIAQDAANATAKAEPFSGDALVYCASQNICGSINPGQLVFCAQPQHCWMPAQIRILAFSPPTNILISKPHCMALLP
jgi:hypothetical protein